MRSELKNSTALLKDMTSSKGVIHRLYKTNSVLKDLAPGKTAVIDLINKADEKIGKKIKVTVMPSTFTHIDSEGKKDTHSNIVPTGIRVEKVRIVTKDGKEESRSEEDITGKFYFDYTDYKFTPEDNGKYTSCEYKYTSQRSWLFWKTTTIEETKIIVTVDEACNFKLKGYNLSREDHEVVDGKITRNFEEHSHASGRSGTLELRAKPHEMPGFTNEMKLRPFEFMLK